MKVLIVDDNKLIRQSLRAHLAGDCQVYQTGDIHRAMEIVNRTGLDWLVINPHLAGNSAFELLYEINSWPDLAGLKIILISFNVHHYGSDYHRLLANLNVRRIESLVDFEAPALKEYILSN